VVLGSGEDLPPCLKIVSASVHEAPAARADFYDTARTRRPRRTGWATSPDARGVTPSLFIAMLRQFQHAITLSW
jgi:hypothetical protein